ncbi:MAG: hydrolase 2, exosortase A system-associated [Pseudomonadota bacterium]
MTKHALLPAFIPTDRGNLFALLHVPDQHIGCVLFVPPFAEEMNKSRRQITQTAQALAAAGYASLVVDLSCTGDSDGEFNGASWNEWQRDIASAMRWAATEGFQVTALIATRLGCVLAAATLRRFDFTVQKSIFWQPIASGSRSMTQFLRLRVASSMMADDAQETVASLKKRLAAGELLEVAGYELSSQLFNEVEVVKLTVDAFRNLGELSVLEVSRIPGADVSAAGRKILDNAKTAGNASFGQRVEGDPFWSSTEIVTSAELTRLSTDFIARSLST